MTARPDNARMRRRQAALIRRRRAGLAGVILLAVLLVLMLTIGGSSGKRAPARHAKPIPAVESGLLPWHLPEAVSRAVVLPGGASHVILLGGLNRSASESAVLSLDTRNGAIRALGALTVGVHDAAGSIVGGRYVVFGGGTPTTVASVQRFPARASAAPERLPSPRSDAASVRIGNTTYIVGGYDGRSADPTVLSTTNGRTFRSVASLRVPVRYPAVAAAAGRLYVFGGQAISGRRAGLPVTDIQQVDPATRASSVIGHMPEPLQASAAVVLAGNVYLAGGDTTTPQPTTPGVGSLQNAAAAHTAGSPALFTTSTIWAFDPAMRRLLDAGRLQVPVSHAGATVLGSRAWIVGGESGASQRAVVQMITPDPAFGTAGAPGAGSPYFGSKLLIADRGSNRLLVLNSSNQILWSFPSTALPSDRFGFFFPDDAFFVDHGAAILSNQEENETVQKIAYPSGKILWEYGHPRRAGDAPGYLHEPDDAYLLKNGQITIADAQNCRVVVINPNRTIAHQIGTAGVCAHDPPHSLGSPNGDTPLADGNLLISEVNGSWIDELTLTGRVVWSIQLPISYPSDPQQLGPNLYLVADYTNPGQIVEFNRAGTILYRYDATSGEGMLNKPSLAERLPSGVIMVDDDYRDRIVAIDPTTQALVWQYGITDQPGTAPGMLQIPDGFDLLAADGSTPTHLPTG